MTYEGYIDLSKITDNRERSAYEIQIEEFGQAPKKLFDKPHPHKYSIEIPHSLEIKEQELPCKLTQWNILKEYDLSVKKPTGIQIIDEKSYIVADSEGSIHIFDLSNGSLTRIIKVVSSSITSLRPLEEHYSIICTKDGVMHLMDNSKLKVIGSVAAHDDAISSIHYDKASHMLFTGSLDSTINIWKINTPSVLPSAYSVHIYDHDSSIVSISSDNNIMVSCDMEGHLRYRELQSPYEYTDIMNVENTECMYAHVYGNVLLFAHHDEILCGRKSDVKKICPISNFRGGISSGSKSYICMSSNKLLIRSCMWLTLRRRR